MCNDISASCVRSLRLYFGLSAGRPLFSRHCCAFYALCCCLRRSRFQIPRFLQARNCDGIRGFSTYTACLDLTHRLIEYRWHCMSPCIYAAAFVSTRSGLSSGDHAWPVAPSLRPRWCWAIAASWFLATPALHCALQQHQRLARSAPPADQPVIISHHAPRCSPWASALRVARRGTGPRSSPCLAAALR